MNEVSKKLQYNSILNTNPNYQINSFYSIPQDRFPAFGRSFNNFPRNVDFSPEGSLLCTTSESGSLTIYDLQNLKQTKPIQQFSLTTPIISFSWRTDFSRSDESKSQLILTTSKGPIELCNPTTGEKIVDFDPTAQDQSKDLTYSLEWGKNLNLPPRFCSGHRKTIKIWDIGRRRTVVTNRIKCGPVSELKFNQSGEIPLLAAGTFSGKLFLLNPKRLTQISSLQLNSGITCIRFSKCGNYIFVGTRKAEAITCYDLRNSTQPMFLLERHSETNQRLNFDLVPGGRYLISGDSKGNILGYDLVDVKKVFQFQIQSKQSVNSVSCHPYLDGVFATSIGERIFLKPWKEKKEQFNTKENQQPEFPIVIWSISEINLEKKKNVENGNVERNEKEKQEGKGENEKGKGKGKEKEIETEIEIEKELELEKEKEKELEKEKEIENEIKKGKQEGKGEKEIEIETENEKGKGKKIEIEIEKERQKEIETKREKEKETEKEKKTMNVIKKENEQKQKQDQKEIKKKIDDQKIVSNDKDQEKAYFKKLNIEKKKETSLNSNLQAKYDINRKNIEHINEKKSQKQDLKNEISSSDEIRSEINMNTLTETDLEMKLENIQDNNSNSEQV
ncbi:hypothetical protein M0812_03795 [Anaeramoeba flamelloides]|uniref:Uncharacterized protein n=1 Tax=Anaeramoeba flamelloides TaxID=1746091 RepID=A0AAV8AIK6_9EUKA|nr:hypothetical protein M0812_03795 [Anaeramoeba flamelloides]